MSLRQLYRLVEAQERYVETNLSEAEKRSLDWYTGENYDALNTALRKNRVLTSVQRKNRDNIDQAFESVPPLEDGLTVYKGLDTSNRSFEKDIFSDKAFVSTSLSYREAKNFASGLCCLLKITVSPGSRVLPLRTVSRKPEEEELLLDRNGILMVTGTTINEEDDMKVIFTTYSPAGSKQVHTEAELTKAESKLDISLVVEQIIKSFQGEDPDFLDEGAIKVTFQQITGKSIPSDELKTIKKRLGMTD